LVRQPAMSVAIGLEAERTPNGEAQNRSSPTRRR
jgi:hypothetical protein